MSQINGKRYNLIYTTTEKNTKGFRGTGTQVTPYAANTTGQAAISLWNVLEGRDPYSTLYPGIINYLIGMHGKVPDSVNKGVGVESPRAEGS